MINLDLLLKQNINISNQLIQSLKVLSMSKIDLDNFLKKENEENVMLDLKDYFSNEKFIADLIPTEKVAIKKETIDFDQVNSKKTTLQDYLIFQLIEKSLDPSRERVIKYLIYSLDSKGYLDISLKDVSTKLNVSISFVKDCQKILTSFDPLGIGAINLKDCLLAQIQTTDEKLKILIENYLMDLYENNYDKILKEMSINKTELLYLIKKLEDLNPYPGSTLDLINFEKLVIPEIFVSFDLDKINIEVNTSNPISLNQHYLELLGKNIDKDTKSYLRNKLSRTLLIKKSIDKRNQTLESIAKYLINYQKDYFIKNLPLRPISQKNLAKALNISESTVSRAVFDKYIESPKGIIGLHDLFSTATRLNTVSKDYILKIVGLLIKEEDKKNPLSDQKIEEKLKKMDIKISRRAIQKYRKILALPSSYKRKKIYEIKSEP
ncbi:MAG: RNA polymerase factor sigma-54 [Peptoniphilaceae bacterium]|nr:RNA polymerase factor sigma-54 [Peptoniphilaceae bacterium]MDY6018815.1 RNA polymerase factor sigma-54 [Anaerococcus sp.]